LRELNPAQRSAVEYGIGGGRRPPPALLIAAGAGTGKTKTLVHRVAHLILDGADPDGFQTAWLPIRGNLLKMVNLGKLNLVSRNARVGQAVTQLLCRPTLPRRQPLPAVRSHGT